MEYIHTSMTKSKQGILLFVLLSAVLDIFTSMFGFTYGSSNIIGAIVFEEFVEWIICVLAARYILDEDLTAFEQIAGLIPIPGITAITVKGVVELLKTSRKAH